MNRLKRVLVSPIVLHDILSRGTRETEIYSDPLPDDAVLVAVDYDHQKITLTYQSDSFEEVRRGERIPEFCPMFLGLSVAK